MENEYLIKEAEQQNRIMELKKYLVEYLDLKSPEQAKEIKFFSVEKLAGGHKEQYDFLADKRLDDVLVAVVPDGLWVKGSQPSESDAEKNLVLFKESAFNNEDVVAWLTHELGHCQRLKDTDVEQYKKDSEQGYPDNEVERHAFSKQFEYLKNKGISQEQILLMLQEWYHGEELDFLREIL
ncbi:hypothetical protein KJ785_04595 [Patescibacteria group bacterium]|nr:hypothetical protein [Patescibacteria group bacterium]